MTTLGEITVIEALAGGIFGWILVELWQRALDSWNYDLIGFRKDWVTTTFIALLATGLFLVYLFYVESPDKPGPNINPPELIGIGPTKTLINEGAQVPFGPDYQNLQELRGDTPFGHRRLTVPRQIIGGPGPNYVQPKVPIGGLLSTYHESVVDDMTRYELSQ